MFEKFIEYQGELYGFNTMQVTKKDGEFLIINLNNEKTITLTGSDVTLPMKYNVLREFLDSGLVYNKKHNVLTFDDLNKPDIYNTDGVYKNEVITKVEVIRTSRLKITLNDDKTRMINLRKLPFWFLVRDYNYKEFVTFTPTDVKWEIKLANQAYTLKYNIRDIVATPFMYDEEIQAAEAEDDKNNITKDTFDANFIEDLAEGEVDGFELANRAIFNPAIPKKKKHRTTSVEKVAIDLGKE